MRWRGRHHRTGEVVDVVCAGGRIDSVESPSLARPDCEAGWIAPAMFDLQINGGAGVAFGVEPLDREDVRRVVGLCHAHGIGGLCPTLITGSREAYRHCFGVLRAVCEESPGLGQSMPCFHLEGPSISPEDGPRGAHPKAHVRPPDRDEFAELQQIAGGRIRLVTLAPELPGALPYIEWLADQGVVVAIGHTAATPEVIRDAVRAGARLSTHLGNGSHALLPRHHNYLWEQLACDGLWASVITDGHHLPESVVRSIVRVKSPKRLVVTCDASSLAGSPPGRYRAWDADLEVQPGGKVVVSGTPFLAGSGVFTDACLAWLLRLNELSLADAVDLVTTQPRRLLGLPELEVKAGSPAELMLFDHGPDEPFRLRATTVAGQVYFANEM